MDSGCKWRQLSHDFSPYSMVSSFYRRARKRGLWKKIPDHLVKKTRVNAGRKEESRYGIIDSQSVKTVTYGDERGIDRKKTKGRKRHITVDVLGCMLSVNVHAANVHDTKSGIVVAKQAFEKYPSIKKFCDDSGYRGTFVNDIKNLYSQTTKQSMAMRNDNHSSRGSRRDFIIFRKTSRMVKPRESTLNNPMPRDFLPRGLIFRTCIHKRQSKVWI